MPPTDAARPTVADATIDHTADREAIRRLIADIEAGFNGNDPELSVAHFAENATAVNVAGLRVAGAEALLEANRVGLTGPLRDQHARYELGEITFLRPDVAIAHKHARAVSADGEPIDLDHSMIALYVFVKRSDRWWVVARQNTLVDR
jgi:uncharacterized protein (TIGR02246 family)